MAAKEKKTNGKKEKVKVTQAMIDKMPLGIQSVVHGIPIISQMRKFLTGSQGYNISGKVLIEGVVCQVSGNVIVVGSKGLK